MAGLPRTLPELVRKAIAGALQDVHVALPGKVLSWDPNTNLADIQVMVQHSVWDDDNGRTYEDLGVLAGVPVKWPRAGGFILTFPMQPGDTGELIFSSTPIGEWRSTNQSSKPADASRHSIGWPTFSPGLCADNNPPAAGDATARQAVLIIGKDGGSPQIRISGTDIKLGATATVPVALSTPTDAGLASMATAIGTLTTAVNAMVTTYASHTHGGVTTGMGVTAGPNGAMTAPPAGPAAPPTTAAALVKAQ